MKPIEFTCVETIAGTPEAIAEPILDAANWSDFTGCWPIPGIRQAQFERRTPEVVGSRIRVTNTDGSSHVETIAEWRPGVGLRMHMTDFSPPVSRLATEFDEIWRFEPAGEATRVTRTFRLHAKNRPAWVALWFVSFLLKRAIKRHMHQLRAKATAAAPHA